MNKRIKKKKAKQAELRRRQELEELKLDPEQIRQAFKSVGTTLSNIFANLSVAFNNVAEHCKRWGEQFDKENSE
ncbi:hypothetical protein ACVR1I_06570 [Streptococcus cameli]